MTMKSFLSGRIIGIIGAGNMGGAILAQAIKHRNKDKRLRPNNFIIAEKDRLKAAFVKRVYKVKNALDVEELVSRSDVIIVAVKPQDIGGVLEEIQYALKARKKKRILIISIAAGISTSYIESKIPDGARVVRAMPNMPASIGEGITALCGGTSANATDLSIAKEIFALLGATVVIKKEGLINAVTAVSGSGPAYLFYIVSAILAAAKRLGLDTETANTLAYHTFIGSMDLLSGHNFDAQALISRVASKGGTTEAALEVFNERQLGQIIIDAIQAAYQRAKELSG